MSPTMTVPRGPGRSRVEPICSGPSTRGLAMIFSSVTARAGLSSRSASKTGWRTSPLGRPFEEGDLRHDVRLEPVKLAVALGFRRVIERRLALLQTLRALA